MQDGHGTRTNTLSTDQDTPQSQSISPIKGHDNEDRDLDGTQGEGLDDQDETPKTESDLFDADDPMDLEGDGDDEAEGEGEREDS